MKTEIPSNILEEYFFRHVQFIDRKSNGDLVGCCPICREGKSWGKKKRFYYSRKHKYFTCKNDAGCPSMDGVGFLKKVGGLTYHEIMDEVKNFGVFDGNDYTSEYKITQSDNSDEDKVEVTLPPLSENIMSIKNPDFFQMQARKEIENRRLDTAVNSVDLYIAKDTTYYDVNSKIHHNRIIIPHKNLEGVLETYQSRSITHKQSQMGRYISCLNAPKTLWGLHSIDYNQKYLVVTEGAFDAFFVKNSVAGAGMELNAVQKKQLQELSVWFDIIWCFDNAFEREGENNVYRDLLSRGEKVFMWGGEFEKYKDFNEYCIDKGVDEITHEQLLEHTYSGESGLKVMDGKTKVIV